MTIDEAIILLKDILEHGRGLTGYSRFDAIKLGIEALKCVIESRRYVYLDCLNPLPGETITE